MIVQGLCLLAGAACVGAALFDVFDTVVVPGQSRGTLKIARRIVFATLPLWRRRAHGGGISTTFAPFTLVASFALWMALLILGFGLMAYALAGSFKPALPSLSQALYVSGSSLVTAGLGHVEVTGAARWLVLGAGFCGLAVMTLAVTYLLEVQSSIADRDTGIFKLKTSAGEPPSAIILLERYAQLGAKDDIPRILQDGRDWCVRVLQSHASHPTLIYFRSARTQSGWPAALGALLDLTLIVECLLDAPKWRGPASLLRQDGDQLVDSLSDIIGLRHLPRAPTNADVDSLLERLGRAGYPLRKRCLRQQFIDERNRLAGCVAAAAAHLGGSETPLLPKATQ